MKKQSLLYNLKQHVFNSVFALGLLLGINKRTVTVLCYHSIGSNGNHYTVSVPKFKSQMETLQKKYTFISLDEAIYGKYNGSKPALVLTIDDGYQDILTVLPFLKKRRIPVTLFVLSDGKNANRRELEHKGKLLTSSMIKSLSKNGVTIGSHSATHADLTEVSIHDLKKEIVDSKKTLELITGKKVSYFAYPKGKYNNIVSKYVRKAGYFAAFSVYPGLVKPSSNTLSISRVVVSNKHNTNDLTEIVSGTSLTIRNMINKVSIKGVRIS